MQSTQTTVDPGEIAKFEAMAAEWWDVNGKFKPLHMLNPCRLDYITSQIAGEFDRDLKADKPFAGLRILDIVAQTAPLLGLFGTVLGMIEAFQALQGAGSQVDPSVLAGGIWVALLTTAAGLAVAMPVSIGLAWLESQLDRDRAMAERILSAIATPLPPAMQPVLAASEGKKVSA